MCQQDFNYNSKFTADCKALESYGSIDKTWQTCVLRMSSAFPFLILYAVRFLIFGNIEYFNRQTHAMHHQMIII